MIIEETFNAILSLRPGAKFTVDGTLGIVWKDLEQTQPSQEEIDEKIAELALLEYQGMRAKEYPSIGDQLDMLWHSMNDGEIPKSQAFFESIKSVKDAYPKP